MLQQIKMQNMTYYYDLGFEWIPEGYEVGDNGWADGKKESASLYL